MSDRGGSIELALALDRTSGRPLPAQLVHELRRAVDDGVLRARDRLPATRVLAERLGVSRGTVVTAYEQLIAEGYFSSGHGRGTRVNPDLGRAERTRRPDGANAVPERRTPLADAPSDGVAPALADLTATPAWRAAWRRAAGSPLLAQSFDVAGYPPLRSEIAEHLRMMRGTVRDPRHMLVTAGAREGLGLILTALGTTHGRELVVGVEESGPSLQQVVVRHGARVVTLPVDAEGLVTAALPDGVLDALIVTPSHQFPTGAVMPIARRRELLAWARRGGSLIIEDDYDAELRYLRAPLPTLAALDDGETGVVAMLGSFSATLSVSLAAGFLVLPANLHRLVRPVRDALGNPVAPILQLALAELLASGELRRHTARLRRRQARMEHADA